ncbi:hypothetical protein PIB30_016846 [Stylosanthes scabra]|uniref:Uncharacterized protein n=1 Tax=Stylosanthes scabra TaxID=79078 RepID=A0ABU6T897_9FABA|nr:hypothetical protein [Stylosanthes scabra]
MLHANTTQVQTTMTVVAQQGRTIEALAEKVARLELHCKMLENKSVGGIPWQPRSLGDIMREIANEKGFISKHEGLAHGKCDSNCGRRGIGSSGPRSCKRKLEFVTFSSEDMNILYSIKQQYAGSAFAFLSHNRTEMLAEETPTVNINRVCLELAFRPPAGMRFVGTELAVAAYIFTNAGEENERLYQDPHCDMSRFRLWSLIPGEELYDDVLNMVVSMCSGKKFDGSTWWLPTTFSQMIVTPELFNKPTMDYIKDRYMGLADDLKRVRGFCLQVYGERALTFLRNNLLSDDEKETTARIAQMMDVARFVEDMLKDKAFWRSEDAFPPMSQTMSPSHLMLVSKLLARKSPVPNYVIMDCGVWVCQWMINHHLWLDYKLEEINASTRMALAVDLVTSPQNPLAEVIWERAVNFWDAEMLKNYKNKAAAKMKSRSPPPSGSETI